MTRDEIMALARQAGGYSTNFNGSWMFYAGDIEKFAALVSEAEREACAQLCELRKGLYWIEVDKTGSDADRAAAIASEECADVIRARGEK